MRYGRGGRGAERAGSEFFAADARVLARCLLGQRLVRVLKGGVRLAGIIVETEAYLGVMDRAAHSFGGRRTARNDSMYGPPGTAYVYFTYGMHWCMNAVCGREGEPTAVLIRALEPTEGLEEMRRRRGLAASAPATTLCSGPAKMCEALGIDRALDGADLGSDGRLFVEQVRMRSLPASRLTNTPRIGVGYAGEWAARRLRWAVVGNPHVSPGRNHPGRRVERDFADAGGRAYPSRPRRGLVGGQGP